MSSSYFIDQCRSHTGGSLILNCFTLNNCGSFKLSSINGLNTLSLDAFDCHYNSSIVIHRCDLSGFTSNCFGLEYIHLSECTNFPISFNGPIRNYRTFRQKGFEELKEWGVNKQKIAKIQKKLYISLRGDAKKAGDKHLEDDFYYSQMYWSRREKFQLIPWLYEFLCCCGSSWRRLLFWFIIIFMFFSFIIYPCFDHTDISPEISSLVSSFPTGKITINKGSSFLYLCAFYLQSAIQVFFLFEFGAAVRNKVKK